MDSRVTAENHPDDPFLPFSGVPSALNTEQLRAGDADLEPLDDRTGPPRHAGGFGGAALQADGRPPSSSRPRPLVPAGRVRRRERGARRERCGSLQRCGARSGVELATSEPWPRRALRRVAL